MARLALLSDKPADAEKLAREAEEVLRSEKAADPKLLATIVIGDASEDANVQVAYTILEARLRARAGDVAATLASLEKARQSTSKENLLHHEFQIRLAAGGIEMAGGREAAGRKRLSDLAKEAAAKGLDLMARQAK